MRRAIWMAAGFVSILELPLARAERGIYGIGSPPAWVRVAADPVADRIAYPEEAKEYRIVDRQVRLDKRIDYYRRFATRINNRSALENQSSISIDFDPAYDRITMHTLRLLRSGSVIDQVERARITVLRRETELEGGLVDGLRTLSIILEDVRVGDVVDYSYTISESDPLGDTRFADWFTMQWTSPVEYSRLRVLHPSARRLRVLDTSSGEAPIVNETPGVFERLWERRNVAALRDESDRPEWHLFFPRVEFSEYRDWQEVRDWALPLYAVRKPHGADLAKLIEDVRSQPDSAARIMRALHVVQEDVRYTGIEIGAGAFRPTDPNVVLKRRYGDCKDKTLLLVTLLREIGIDAAPALVNSAIKSGVRQRLAAPSAFDHVVARVRHEDQTYWLDATVSGQSQSLATVSQASFGLALVLAPDTPDLVEIARPSPKQPLYEVDERFDLSPGLDQTATLDVITYYRGAQADYMRRKMRGKTIGELTEEYLDYYHGRYPGVRTFKPLKTEDDAIANVFTVREHYQIDKPFSDPDEDNERRFGVRAHAVDTYVEKPDQPRRTTPLALTHPANVKHRISIKLPEEWQVDPAVEKISGPGFDYRSSVRYSKNLIRLEYDFRSTQDHVPVAEIKQYLAKIDSVSDDLDYSLWKTSISEAVVGQAPSIPMLLATLFAAIAGIFLAIRLWHYDPAPRAEAPADAPVGLGGWMILPLVGACISIPAALFGLYQWSDFFSAHEFAAVGSRLESAAAALWMKSIVLMLVASLIVLFAVSIAVVMLLFARRTAFPRAYILMLWGAQVAGAISLVAIGMSFGVESVDFTKEVAGSIRDLLSAIVWTAYLMTSKRVLATFRSRRGLAFEPMPAAV